MIGHIFSEGTYMFDLFIQCNIKILLVLVAFGFIMGRARQSAWRNFSKNARGYFLLDFFNLIGTPVHELSHLIFALLFGYHIDKVCLYRRIKTAKKNGGTLGYVKMHYEGQGLFHSLRRDTGLFFIGIGPLLLPPFLLFLGGQFLPDNLQALPAAFQNGTDSFFKALQQLGGADIIIMFAYLYVIISVSMNMELSRQDLHMAAGGLLMLELLFLLLSVCAHFFGWNPEAFIDFLFQWNLLIASIGIICGLTFNLISLISS